MLRVFFTLGYAGRRRWNWIVGICILSMVLLSCFTGYLLPWDQTAFWAVTICINLMDYVPGGQWLKALITDNHEVSQRTLHLFYTLHTSLIPALLLPFLAVHFWKVRKAKGVVTAGLDVLKKEEKPVMAETKSNLLPREAVAALVLTAFVMLLSSVFKAPLGDMANAGLSPNPAKAPWYFAGFQELLFHFHPFYSVFIIPALSVFMMVGLPFIPWDVKAPGRWFISKKAANATGFAVLSAFILVPALVLADEFMPDIAARLPGLPFSVSGGLIPFTLVAVLTGCLHFVLKSLFRLSRIEAFQATAAFLTASYAVLTLTCVWFRGTDMMLCFPGG